MVVWRQEKVKILSLPLDKNGMLSYNEVSLVSAGMIRKEKDREHRRSAEEQIRQKR